MLFPILSAVFCILAFNTKFYFLIFVGLVPLFLFFIEEKKLWRLILGAFLFRLIFALGTVYFVMDPILYFVSLVIFSGFPISFYLIRKYISPVAGISLPFLWVVWDHLEAQYTFLPMTLIMAGIPLANSPFLGIAKFGGVIGLTFFAALVNYLIAYLFLAVKRSVSGEKKAYWQPIVLLVAVLSGAFWGSNLIIGQNKEDYLSKSNVLDIAVLSANEVKYNFDDRLDTAPLNGAKLLFLPENMYKTVLKETFLATDLYKEKAKKLGIDLFVAMLRYDGGKTYTSGVLFSKDGEIADLYNKNILTLTSENWPFEKWRPFYFNSYFKNAPFWETQKAIFYKEYQHTAGEPKLVSASGFSFFSPICQEIHYPAYVKNMMESDPDLILHTSNNDWMAGGADNYRRFTNNLRKIYAVWLNKPIVVNGIRDYAGIFYPDGGSDLKYPSTGSGQAPSTGSGQAPSTGSGQAPLDGEVFNYVEVRF